MHDRPLRRVKLNGSRMKSGKGAHSYMAKKLRFPSYYGNNLDALYDALSTIGEPVEILIKNTELLRANIGEYGQAIIRTFEDAAGSNSNLTILKSE